ncbi:hypothetical protein BN2476_320158 [Paraburkholderia piptadeniae]|uniref:Uncharacterized protein n=1 Tax=Paraburkholderia piptadeniae TaxID=1701573 RepID=A0A1N7S514_9BURK|nr:hypothetical protein BN2476_320158 [Paraburkholderia piptadeniae]
MFGVLRDGLTQVKAARGGSYACQAANPKGPEAAAGRADRTRQRQRGVRRTGIGAAPATSDRL